MWWDGLTCRGSLLNQGSRMLPAAQESPLSWLNRCAVTPASQHRMAVRHTGWKQLQLHNYSFQPCHLPISFIFFFLPSNDINIPSGFLCRTETGTRAGGRATYSRCSPGTALARSRSPQQHHSLGRTTGWGREGWQHDTSCLGTKGWSPGWRLDGDYVLMGMVPVAEAST